jgi:hypothetical protein
MSNLWQKTAFTMSNLIKKHTYTVDYSKICILQVQNWKSFLPHFTEIISRDSHAEILRASTKSSPFVKCVKKAAFFKVKFASKSSLFVKCKICIERPLFCTSNLCQKEQPFVQCQICVKKQTFCTMSNLIKKHTYRFRNKRCRIAIWDAILAKCYANLICIFAIKIMELLHKNDQVMLIKNFKVNHMLHTYTVDYSKICIWEPYYFESPKLKINLASLLRKL